MINFTDSEKKELLNVARSSILHGFSNKQILTPNYLQYSASLQKTLASFVTIEINKNLRGCIGSLMAQRPLVVDVAANAYAAAFQDPRFKKLTVDEFNYISLHISVLSEATPMEFSSEENLLQQLRPNVDGLILLEGNRRSTFLPTVWEQLPRPVEFLQHLKLKGGWAIDYWSQNMQVFRYTTTLIE